MPERQGILLTGATGLLGQYLLHDLLVKARPVAVLVRDARQGRAESRIAQLVASWNERVGRELPTPVILNGDLGEVGLGLTAADGNWLARHCNTVVHSAANLSFRQSPDGEPWRTNVAGTKSLLDLVRDLGISNWHQISTAFVCGRRRGIIAEEDFDGVQSFHNAYEESKLQAERLVRDTPGVRATFHRPSVIVGDALTGHTTKFAGLYSFLELAARLASRDCAEADGSVPVRLPLTGDEPWNLVPVDWVSRAIIEVLGRRRIAARSCGMP